MICLVSERAISSLIMANSYFLDSLTNI